MPQPVSINKPVCQQSGPAYHTCSRHSRGTVDPNRIVRRDQIVVLPKHRLALATTWLSQYLAPYITFLNYVVFVSRVNSSNMAFIFLLSLPNSKHSLIYTELSKYYSILKLHNENLKY